MDLVRRQFLATAAAGLCAACSNLRVGDAYTALNVLIGGMPDVPLTRTRFIDTDPVARGLHRLEGPVDARRIIDIDRGHAFNIPVTSSLEPVRHERIEILGLSFDTVMVRERNVAELLDWRFENTFWADRETGFIWKSVQHIVDRIPPLEFEILKPAA